MDFDLSDEQRMLQQTVSQFLDNECPMAKLRQLFDDEIGFDPVLWKGLAELGVAGIHLPAEYGGSELEILDLAVVAETLGAHAAPVPFFSHALASLAIQLAGSAEQKQRLLPALASGERIATIAFSEESEGWLPEQWTLAADAFGGADKLVATSVAYAKNREQFGVIIGSFQGLKHQLAEMAIEIEPSRALYWYAAHAQDHAPEEASRIASIAKSHLSERYSQVARDATEVHGGIGYTWEGDTQIWFKRAMFDRVMLGTPRLHKNRAADLAGW